MLGNHSIVYDHAIPCMVLCRMHRSLHDHSTGQLTKLTQRAEAAEGQVKEWQAKHDKVLHML
jgi:nitrite reductase/ring-hydroxylating ferredoxin subunit